MWRPMVAEGKVGPVELEEVEVCGGSSQLSRRRTWWGFVVGMSGGCLVTGAIFGQRGSSYAPLEKNGS